MTRFRTWLNRDGRWLIGPLVYVLLVVALASLLEAGSSLDLPEPLAGMFRDAVGPIPDPVPSPWVDR